MPRLMLLAQDYIPHVLVELYTHLKIKSFLLKAENTLTNMTSILHTAISGFTTLAAHTKSDILVHTRIQDEIPSTSQSHNLCESIQSV